MFQSLSISWLSVLTQAVEKSRIRVHKASLPNAWSYASPNSSSFNLTITLFPVTRHDRFNGLFRPSPSVTTVGRAVTNSIFDPVVQRALLVNPVNNMDTTQHDFFSLPSIKVLVQRNLACLVELDLDIWLDQPVSQVFWCPSNGQICHFVVVICPFGKRTNKESAACKNN